MEQVEKKYFDAYGNFDDADFVVGEREYVNLRDMRFGSTDKDSVGTLDFIGSTVDLFALTGTNPLPAGVNTCIGVAEDEARRRLLWFNHNDNDDHGIYLYDSVAVAIYSVLLDNQVTGGFEFDESFLIHSARIIGNMLYWVDAHNQPRRINIEAGIKLNHPGYSTDVAPYESPLDKSVITLIRRQPGMPPVVEKIEQVTPVLLTNQIKGIAVQFNLIYDYRDYERSCLGDFSKTMNYNTEDENFNSIDVTIPLGEQILQDVQRIHVVVKYMDTGKCFIVKTWNKISSADLAAINLHNAGTTALVYRFYNDRIGISVDDASVAKPFDSVPVYSRAMEIARNRLFLGYNTEGYTAPAAGNTSLVVTPVTSSASVLTGQWVKIAYNSGANFHYFLDLGGTLGFFDVVPQPSIPPYPSTVDYTGNMAFVAPGPADFGLYILAHFSGWVGGIQYPGFSATITDGPAPPTVIGAKCFKSDSTYQAGIMFYDFAGRFCGVVTNDDLIFKTVDKAYNQAAFTTGANWVLSNVNALTEIPDFAEYYAPCLTLGLRTRFFQEMRAKAITYCTSNGTGGFTFADTTYASTRAGIAIDISTLLKANMGYVFTAGDLVKIYLNGASTVYTLAITGQSGDYIICELKDVGTLNSSSKADFEIYTPYKRSTTEFFYAQGEKFKINDPGMISRAYSTLNGTLDGDVTLLSRDDAGISYLVEAMSPSDKFWQNWFTNAGRPNLVDTIGQQVKTQNISFSNVLIPGTKTNGLSTFDALDETNNIPMENGPVQKLMLAERGDQDQGTVMLVISQFVPSSVYLGEAQILGSTGTAFLASASGVIGTINTLTGGYGTLNPESVFEFLGRVYWFDAYNACIIRYSKAGLLPPISDYKATRFWKQFSLKYLSTPAATIESYGSRPFVFGGVDPYHKEILFAVPQVETVNPRGNLVDFDPAMEYPYDIYDGKNKTLVFKDKNNKWQGSYSWTPEYFGRIGSDLYSFKNGMPFGHNDSSGKNNFYGTNYKGRVMVVSTAGDSKVKSYKAISIESATAPSFVHFRSEKFDELGLLEQSSDLDHGDFSSKEGLWYSSILRNRLDANVSGQPDTKRLTAGIINGQTLKILAEFDPALGPAALKFINIIYRLSSGHKN